MSFSSSLLHWIPGRENLWQMTKRSRFLFVWTRLDLQATSLHSTFKHVSNNALFCCLISLPLKWHFAFSLCFNCAPLPLPDNPNWFGVGVDPNICMQNHHIQFLVSCTWGWVGGKGKKHLDHAHAFFGHGQNSCGGLRQIKSRGKSTTPLGTQNLIAFIYLFIVGIWLIICINQKIFLNNLLLSLSMIQMTNLLCWYDK